MACIPLSWTCLYSALLVDLDIAYTDLHSPVHVSASITEAVLEASCLNHRTAQSEVTLLAVCVLWPIQEGRAAILRPLSADLGQAVSLGAGQVTPGVLCNVALQNSTAAGFTQPLQYPRCVCVF